MRILSTLNRELLKPSASIALHRHSNALVDILPPEADSSISLLTQSERPDVSYTVRHWLILASLCHDGKGSSPQEVALAVTVANWWLYMTLRPQLEM